MDEHSSAPPSSDSLPGTNSTKQLKTLHKMIWLLKTKQNPQKPSKFKQILKYFVNSYDKFEETVFINYLFY